MRSHAAAGFVFSALAQLARIATQFASVIVMARLLEPSDFGLIAMVWPVYGVAVMVQNLGINQAVIQKPALTAAQVNSFFWINCGVGALVCLVLILLSPAVGWFYGDPRTVPLTIAMAALVMVSGLGNLHGAIMIRRLQFRLQTGLGVLSSLAGLLGSVWWGLAFGGYWALYFGLALAALVSLAGVWIKVGWLPGRPALVPETGQMLRFGLGITATNLADLITNSVTNATIGSVLGDRATGLYDRASRLLSTPLLQLIQPINGVAAPILYRLHDDPERYRRTFQRMLGMITLLITPGIVWTISEPERLIATFLGEKWQEAAPIFAALSLAALPQLVNSAVGWLFVTQGRAGDNARWGLVNAGVTIAALFAGLPFGLIGIAIASALSQFLRAPALWWYASRSGPVRFRDIIGVIGPQAAGGAAAFLALTVFTRLPGPDWALLGGGLALSYLAALAVVALFPSGRAAIRREAAFALYILGRARARATPAPRPEASS